MKRADELFSKYIRQRDGKCVKCGKQTSLQCAHIVGRRNFHLRYDPQNAITLCYRCHIHWQHKEPLEFTRWLEVTDPTRVSYLERERPTHEKVDYDETIRSLNSLLKKV